MPPASPNGFIPPHGGYQKLLTYRRAEIVYQATVRFCERWLDRRDRTVDQMVQAARSGKQNIVEGSMASAVSTESEIRLTNVARASLEELAEDLRDFLRLRSATEWSYDDRRARRLSEMLRTPNSDYETVRPAVEHDDPVIAANAILGVTKVTIILLGRQIRRLESNFLARGGIRERMTSARLESRRDLGREMGRE